MLDADIVRAIAAGERNGLSEAYRAYADRLYDYCLRLLGDPEAAADAVHDAFLIARERITQLRDPNALRPWLYAIARSQCHRVLRRRNRFTPLDEATDMSDKSLDPPETDVHRQELRTLVWTAMSGLNPREHEVIHLTLRHQLDGPGLAAVLGVSVKQANAVAATARAQLERALGALLVARTRGRECEALRVLLREWNGEFTPLWRKRINRHMSSCEDCQRKRAMLAAPESLLSALPLAVAPAFLHDQLLTNAFDPDLVRHHAEFADQAGPYRPDGFPERTDTMPGPSARSSGTRLPSALALAAGLLILVMAGWMALPLLAERMNSGGREAFPVVSLEPDKPESAKSDPPAPTVADETADSESPEGSESPDTVEANVEDEPSLGERTEQMEQTEEEWPGADSDPPNTLLTVAASGQDATPPGCFTMWTLSVSAQSEGASAASLTVSGDFGSRTVAMQPGNTPGSWYASVDGLPMETPIAWSVTVSDSTGSTANSSGTASREGCTDELF